MTLHDDRGGLNDLIPLARSLDPDLRIVSPEAARGVYRGTDLVARTWFGGSLTKPEPASFGDSLAQLEQFVLDVQERWEGVDPRPPWLLGSGQGAVLALSLALVAPELITGVLAIRGCLPTFSKPDLLEPAPSELPVLLVGDRAEDSPPVLAVEATAALLTDLGARVKTAWVDGAHMVGPALAEELRGWLVGRLVR